MPKAIGQPAVLDLELFVDRRPFSELDDYRLGNGELAERARVGPEAVRQHIGVAAVVLGSRDSEAVAKAVELLAIDGIN
jgi:hypothetical protein